MGNSTNKKDAQTNAARDFVNFLVRIGEVNAAEVPTVAVGTRRIPTIKEREIKQTWTGMSGLRILADLAL